MEIVSCTACGRQVNHFQRDALFRHPVLRVLICKVSLHIYQYFTIVQSVIQIYFTIFCDLKVVHIFILGVKYTRIFLHALMFKKHIIFSHTVHCCSNVLTKRFDLAPSLGPLPKSPC